tara:strand:+ start:735 stop:1358 length:624 start_codon:yes stop_codon:yes gene_type:complete
MLFETGVCHKLLFHGGDPSIEDIGGNTAIHFMAEISFSRELVLWALQDKTTYECSHVTNFTNHVRRRVLKSYHAETRGESPQKGAQEVSAFRAPLRVSSDQGEILVDQNQKVENVVEERVTIGLSFERERIRLYFQLLEMVIKNGEGLAVMNHKGETPLHFAARAKCVHSVFWLCVHGADVNAQTEEGQNYTSAKYSTKMPEPPKGG